MWTWHMSRVHCNIPVIDSVVEEFVGFGIDCGVEPMTFAIELHHTLVDDHMIGQQAAGAGFSLAIFPDIVLFTEDARLEYVYPRIGLTGDGGTTFFLPRLVGLRRARETLLLDEPIEPA